MWSQCITFAAILAICASEITAPGIDRHVTEGIRSLGYKVVYGDEDMTVINQVVSDMEKNDVLKKNRFKEAIPVMPAEDVKCLMSVDKYCSKEMVQMKSVLVQALTEDCATCTPQEKEKAGRIVASMLAHDPVAWKMFLTRSALQTEQPKERSKVEELKLTSVGEPEDVRSVYKYTKPGFKVRVKRFAAEKLPEKMSEKMPLKMPKKMP